MEQSELSETTLKIGIGIIIAIMVIGLIWIVIDVNTPVVSLVPVWIVILVPLTNALKELKLRKTESMKN